jgi:hypothetical protein
MHMSGLVQQGLVSLHVDDVHVGHVGANVGCIVSDSVGCIVGDLVGGFVGDFVGCFVGDLVGGLFGFFVGGLVGCFMGDLVGGLTTVTCWTGNRVQLDGAPGYVAIGLQKSSPPSAHQEKQIDMSNVPSCLPALSLSSQATVRSLAMLVCFNWPPPPPWIMTSPHLSLPPNLSLSHLTQNPSAQNTWRKRTRHILVELLFWRERAYG